jgi:DNA-binding response OmpR family regulator
MTSKQILIVDDNPDLARSITILVESWGHHVCVASDGAAALVAARAQRFDLVLVDIGLPGIDGFQLAAALRREPGTVHARIVSMSGLSRAEDTSAAWLSGVDQHLVKPLEPRLLLSLLGVDACQLPGLAGNLPQDETSRGSTPLKGRPRPGR